MSKFRNRGRRDRQLNLITLFVFLNISLILLLFFSERKYLNIEISMGLMAILSLSIIYRSLNNRNILGLYTLLILITPAWHIFEVYFFGLTPEKSYFLSISSFWSVEIIEILLCLFLAVLLGYASGVTAHKHFFPNDITRSTHVERVINGTNLRARGLHIGIFVIISIITATISWAATGNGTIFSSSYHLLTDNTIVQHFPFIRAAIFSLLVVLFMDTFALWGGRRDLTKITIFSLLLVYCVGINLLAKGDREGLPLLLGFILLYPRLISLGTSETSTYYKLAFPGVSLVIFLAVLLQHFRDNVTLEQIQAIVGIPIIASLSQGPWTSILLSPLSVSHDRYHGIENWHENYNHYKSLILNLPPSFLMKWFDPSYEHNRSIGAELIHGGGMHSIVAPYVTFGFAGIILVHFIIGFTIRHLERSYYKLPWSRFTLYCQCCAMYILPGWLWYGDKVLITSLIVSLIIFLAYQLSSGRVINTKYRCVAQTMRMDFRPGKRQHELGQKLGSR